MSQKLGHNLWNSWKRYLDDCFIFWKHSEEDLLKFPNLLNTINPNIQFTLEYSNTPIPFLDVKVIKSGTEMLIDIFYKTTDTHQYLNSKSCHPTHTCTKRSTPYNLARRICTIVTDEGTRDQRLTELKTYLAAQNYPETIILSAINETKKIPQHTLRTTRKKKTTIRS
jgi:hypothetical protein